MRALPLLLLAMLAAGCSAPGGDERKEGAPPPGVFPDQAPCARAAAGTPAGNAPLVAALQEDPEAVVRRLAEVHGEALEGAPLVGEGGDLRWETPDAIYRYTRADAEGSPVVRVAREARAAWSLAEPEARDLVARAVAAFGVDAASVDVAVESAEPVRLAFEQRYQNEPVRGTGGFLATGEPGLLVVGPLHEVPAEAAFLPEERLVAAARDLARCVFDAEELTEARGHPIETAEAQGLGVREESLTRVVRVTAARGERAGPCAPALDVHVDAVAGHVHAWRPPPCF